MKKTKEKELEKVIDNIKKKNYKDVRNKLIKWIIKDFFIKGIPIGFAIGLVAIIPFHIFNYKITSIHHIEILTFSALFYAILRVIFIETKEEQIISLTQYIEKITKENQLDSKTIEKLALYKKLKMNFRNLYLILFTFLIDTALAKLLTLL